MTHDPSYRLGWQAYGFLLLLVVSALVVGAALVGAIWLATTYLGPPAALAWAGLLVLLFWLLGASYRARREQANAMALANREPYWELAGLLHQLAASPEPAEAAFKRQKELDKWDAKLVVMGSDPVVNAWNFFRRVVDRCVRRAENGAVLTAIGLLLLAIRRDSGNRATRLSPDDLIAYFLDDEEDEQDEEDEDDQDQTRGRR